MANLLDQIRLWIEQIVASLGYVGIALVMFLENIFPPIPSEVIMPFAGSLVAKGELNLPGVLAAGTVGALLGAVVIYYIGVWINRARARHWFAAYGRFVLMSTEDFDRAMTVFRQHGGKMVFIGRLMPAIRSLISLPAGLEKMTFPTFLLLTALGTTLWNLLLAYFGLILGQNWRQILRFVDAYETIFWVVFALGIGFFLIKRLSGWQHEPSPDQ